MWVLRIEPVPPCKNKKHYLLLSHLFSLLKELFQAAKASSKEEKAEVVSKDMTT